MKCRRITAWVPISMHTSKLLASKKLANPPFPLSGGPHGLLTDKHMNRIDAYRMVLRRGAKLGMNIRIGGHTFRADLAITAYLQKAARSRMRSSWLLVKARARLSFAIAPAMRSRSMRWRGF